MIIDYKSINKITENVQLDCFLREAFFIDIETTGLSREYSDIISITVLLYEENSYKIYQLYNEYKIDEASTLKYLKELVASKKYIITYNGNSFDIPFLNYKYKKHNINFNLNLFVKVDLYRWVKQLKNNITNINDYKLKTIEKYFNIDRSDTLSGNDIITLYEAYKIEPRKEFSHLIMQHNYEDVFNLPLLLINLLNLYDSVLFYDEIIIMITKENICIKKDMLKCSFNIVTGLNTDYINKNINYEIAINNISQTMSFSIPLNFFKDQKIKEFYFIDNNDYSVKKYISIEGIKKNLLPVKFNNKIFYDNIINLIITISTKNLVFIT